MSGVSEEGGGETPESHPGEGPGDRDDWEGFNQFSCEN